MSLFAAPPAARRPLGHALLILLWAVFVSAVPQRASAQDTAGVSAAGVSATAAPAAASAPGDVARPGDVVRVRVWRDPELSGEFVIDRTGTAVLPRIGRVTVAGMPEAAMIDRVVGAYRPLLSHSSVEVTLLRRVQILGAVRNPGLYPLDATMTVADALALAGGPTSQGKQTTVRLVRDGREVEGGLSLRTKLSDSSIHSGDQIYVPERHFAIREPAVIAAALSSAAVLAVALFHR